MDRRAGTGPRGRAGLLFLLRAEPLQAAHHFAPHAQAHHHAARRARTPRRPRHPAPLPAARLTAAQYAALRTALRQPHRRLYRRTVEDGSADGGDRPRTAPHPYPVLHPQRRPDGLPPAGRPGRKGARRRPGTHPLRRRRQPGCQELLFQRDARRRDRSIRLPARQIPALHQQGQLPQPPQDRRDRRPHRIHRRHEHRRPLRPRHAMGHMARHPFPHRRQRRRRAPGLVPERLVGDYENAYFGAGATRLSGILRTTSSKSPPAARSASGAPCCRPTVTPSPAPGSGSGSRPPTTCLRTYSTRRSRKRRSQASTYT